MHIEKTAGSSVVSYLTSLYPESAIDPDPYRGAPGHILQPIPDPRRQYALTHGHYDLPALLRSRQQRKLCVFFRRPDQRILSLYDYWRAITPEEIEHNRPHAGMIAARARGLLDFLRSPEPEVRDFIDNVYARRLTGLYLSSSDAMPSDAGWLDSALAGLGRIDFVGTVERMSDSLLVLSRHLDAPPPGLVPHVNKLSDMVLDPASVFVRHPSSTLAARERAAIAPLVRLDWPIYEAACARLAAGTV